MNQRALLAVLISLIASAPATAMAAGCSFNSEAQKFSGSPIEQARCLLRRVLPGGIVSATPSPLTPFLISSIGKPVAVSKQELSAYLKKQKISDREIGGSLGKGVSSNHSGSRALYFVIHDTSDSLGGQGFPTVINDAGYGLNRIDRRDISMAHIMINRAGQSNTGREYSGSLTATKLERIKDNTDGLFLHHEMVQPRIKGSWSFHAVGPKVGFPEAQMKRLALLYVVASVRRGSWMIPAYHATIDEGIPDGHDDPQNFDLDGWSRMVTQVVAEVKPQPVVQEPSDEQRAAEKKAAEQKAAEQKAAEQKAAEQKAAEQKAAAQKAAEQKAAEQKAADQRTAALRAAARKAAEEQKAAERKAAEEQKAAEKKAAEQKPVDLGIKLPELKDVQPEEPRQVEPKKVEPKKEEPKKVVPPLPVKKPAEQAKPVVKKPEPKKVVPVQKVAPKKVVPVQKVAPKKVAPQPKPRPRPRQREWWEKPFWEWDLFNLEGQQSQPRPIEFPTHDN